MAKKNKILGVLNYIKPLVTAMCRSGFMQSFSLNDRKPRIHYRQSKGRQSKGVKAEVCVEVHSDLPVSGGIGGNVKNMKCTGLKAVSYPDTR